MIEEKEEIWIAEVVTAEMTEEVVAVIEEAAEVVQEVAVVKAEEVADPVVVEEVVDLVVVVEVAVAEEQVAAVEEEDKFEIKIKNKKLVTRNFIKCYNRKDRNTGKCRKAV